MQCLMAYISISTFWLIPLYLSNKSDIHLFLNGIFCYLMMQFNVHHNYVANNVQSRGASLVGDNLGYHSHRSTKFTSPCWDEDQVQ